MVSLEWMTQLCCGPLLNSCHGQWPLRVDLKRQQVGVLSAPNSLGVSITCSCG
jgi:hypothetical protein